VTGNLEGRIKQLEARVQELADQEAIRNLRYRYHEIINQGNYAAVPDLFTTDGMLDFDYLGGAKGTAELMVFFTQRLGNLFSFIKQFVHNHAVQVHGDTATGFSFLEARTVVGGESYMVAARYDDEYVREYGHWKFKKMTLMPYFTVPLREGWAQPERLKMGK